MYIDITFKWEMIYEIPIKRACLLSILLDKSYMITMIQYNLYTEQHGVFIGFTCYIIYKIV